MFWYNKTVVEFDFVQQQISFAWSSYVRLNFALPNITCHGKTNLMLDSVSPNNCLVYEESVVYFNLIIVHLSQNQVDVLVAAFVKDSHTQGRY